MSEVKQFSEKALVELDRAAKYYLEVNEFDGQGMRKSEIMQAYQYLREENQTLRAQNKGFLNHIRYLEKRRK